MSDTLESVLLLARQATGKALVSLIDQALSSPTIYTFSELLAMANVRELANSSTDAKGVKALKLFSIGTYEDYAQGKHEYPDLNATQLYKLKKLSLISISAESNTTQYADLLKRLDLCSTRELEDLIIDAIYSGLIKAKLNTRDQSVYIESTVGRDLDPEKSLDTILASLDSWNAQCASVLHDIQTEIEVTREAKGARLREQKQHKAAIEQVQRQTQSTSTNQSTGPGSRNKRNGGLTEDYAMDVDARPVNEYGGASVMPSSGRKRKVPSKSRR